MGFLRGKGRACGSGIRALVLGLVLTGWASGQRGRRADDPPDLIERALAEPRTLAELRRRLSNVEATEIPRLFQLAAEGRLPDADAIAPLDDDERQAVREALCSRPRREIVPFLEDLASRPMESTFRRRRARLQVRGRPPQLLARLTQPRRSRHPVEPELPPRRRWARSRCATRPR
jgi:hypothetical protein